MLYAWGGGERGRSQFPSPSGQALAESLKSNRSLKSLWLEKNNIGDSGAEVPLNACPLVSGMSVSLGIAGALVHPGLPGGVSMKISRKVAVLLPASSLLKQGHRQLGQEGSFQSAGFP